jgi:hypothetical protein
MISEYFYFYHSYIWLFVKLIKVMSSKYDRIRFNEGKEIINLV